MGRSYNGCSQRHGNDMSNRRKKISMQSRQRGMALIAALFLIVVLASLGLFAVRIGGAQQQTVNLGLLGDRAVAAANSGIEYSIFRQINTGCASANATINMNQSALAGFKVVVACSGTGPFTFTASASSGTYGSPDYVSRTVTR
jgi:MSHA biogenesis protein MshP